MGGWRGGPLSLSFRGRLRTRIGSLLLAIVASTATSHRISSANSFTAGNPGRYRNHFHFQFPTANKELPTHKGPTHQNDLPKVLPLAPLDFLPCSVGCSLLEIGYSARRASDSGLTSNLQRISDTTVQPPRSGAWGSWRGMFRAGLQPPRSGGCTVKPDPRSRPSVAVRMKIRRFREAPLHRARNEDLAVFGEATGLARGMKIGRFGEAAGHRGQSAFVAEEHDAERR